MTFDDPAACTSMISGWGGYPAQRARIICPAFIDECKTILSKQPSLIVRGRGRSYGDSANSNTVVLTDHWNHFSAFDSTTGLLRVESGMTLREVLKTTVHHGWFLPVVPGTSFATVGGAIASDVHGKNHPRVGTLSEHILSMTLLLGEGEVVTTSRSQLPDLFHATCGGMGLTGAILSATIQLVPIGSAFMEQNVIKAESLEEVCERFEAESECPYKVAWIDCLASRRNFGRGVLKFGKHLDTGGIDLKIKDPVKVPFAMPKALLNRFTVGTFNKAYWAKHKQNDREAVSLMSYFFPLDQLGNWNRLYGRTGFIQYQFVLPKIDGVANLRKVLNQMAKSGSDCYLAVLKQLGASNRNLLSFPMEGYSLALDFRASSSNISFLHQLDDMIAGMGGKVYLAKDALIKETSFKATYPKWREFQAVRERYGAVGKFSSAQSKRLGLG